MEQILEDIECIPGINGVYYYSTTYGTIAKKTGEGFTDKKLAIVGKTLVRIHSEGSKAFSDINKVALYFKEANLIIHKVTSENYLVIIHDRNLNRNLLNMTMAQALQDLKGKNGYIPQEESTQQDNSNKKSASDDTASSDDTTRELAARSDNSALQEALEAMDSKLQQIMGPLATDIFQEALTLWKKQGEPGPETIPALVLLICTEINDPQKINTYKVLIDPYLKAFEQTEL